MAVALSFTLSASDQQVSRAFEHLADKAEGAERALRDINDVDFAGLVGSATAAALAVEHEFKQAARGADRALDDIDVAVGIDRQRGLIRRSLARAFTPDAATVSGLTHSLSTALSTPVGAAIAVGIVGAAAPLLISGIGAAVLAGAGAGILGIGALVAAQSDAVKSKLAGAAEQIKGVFTRAASSLIAPFALAVDTIGDAVARMEPAFTRMFAAMAPVIQPFTKAMIAFVENALPGLEAAMPGIVTAFAALGAVMPELGRAFGEFLVVISQNQEAIVLVINILADLAGALIVGLGHAIKISQTLLLALRDVFNRVRADVSRAMAATSAAVGASVAAVAGFFRRLGALPGIVGGYFARVLTAASSRLASLVATVRGIPGRILAALGNLGRLLYGAGLSLVAGLASGIGAGLGSVVAAARRVVQSAISAAWAAVVPGSPSRLMAEVGRNMAEGLAAGLQEGARLPAAAVRGIIGDAATLLRHMLAGGTVLEDFSFFGAGKGFGNTALMDAFNRANPGFNFGPGAATQARVEQFLRGLVGGGATLAGAGGGIGFGRPLNITVHMSNAAVGTPEQIAAGLAYALRVELLRIDRRGPVFG